MINEDLIKEIKQENFLTEGQIEILENYKPTRNNQYILRTIKNKCIKVLENYNIAKKLLIELNKK